MKEALKLALEALYEYVEQHGQTHLAKRAMPKLREALAQPEQEPVAWMRHDGQRVTTASDRHNYPDYETRYSIPLYTTPPQRKPLTDEEIWQIATDCTIGGDLHADKFAKAIEDKLKEKNNG
jgi:hypothetical protein